MSGFRLAELDHTLLEKVITKLEPNSYFRLQQTCRGMQEFIRKSKNISIHLDGRYCFRKKSTPEEVVNDHWWAKCMPYLNFDENGCKLKFRQFCKWEINVAELYGTRLPLLLVTSDIKEVDRICDCLRKYQITSEGIDIAPKWTKEDFVEFLRIAKPRRVSLNSAESDRYEAVFQAKSIKTVAVDLKAEQIVVAIPKLLFAFADVEIHIHNTDDQFDLLRTCLQILHSQPWPNLRHFNFCIIGGNDVSTTSAELKTIFHGYNLTVNAHDFLVEVPQHFYAATSCNVILSYPIAHLYCGNVNTRSHGLDEKQTDTSRRGAVIALSGNPSDTGTDDAKIGEEASYLLRL